jgi:hypothetical protein
MNNPVSKTAWMMMMNISSKLNTKRALCGPIKIFLDDELVFNGENGEVYCIGDEWCHPNLKIKIEITASSPEPLVGVVLVGKECLHHICAPIKQSEFVFVTGNGYLDHATQTCLFRVSTALNLPTCAAVDCKPDGFGILWKVQCGREATSLDPKTYAMPEMHWLFRPSFIATLDVRRSDLFKLSTRDHALVKELMEACKKRDDSCYLKELALMLEPGFRKVDLEAILGSVGEIYAEVVRQAKQHISNI